VHVTILRRKISTLENTNQNWITTIVLLLIIANWSKPLPKQTGFVGYNLWKTTLKFNPRIFGNTFLDLKRMNMLLTNSKLAKR
jgi:uncharacterized protein YukJ